MASIVPSPALLNARLTSEKLALEEQLRAFAKKNRDLEQRNASLTDEVEEKDRAIGELRAHVLRLLGAGAKKQTLPPGQGLLFADAPSDAVTTAIEDLASPEEEIEAVELEGDDAEVPDAEEPEEDKPGRNKPRDREARKLDQSNLRRQVRRSELPPEQRRCPVTGIDLVETGVKVTTEVEYKAAELFLIEHHQAIYGPSPDVAIDCHSSGYQSHPQLGQAVLRPPAGRDLGSAKRSRLRFGQAVPPLARPSGPTAST